MNQFFRIVHYVPNVLNGARVPVAALVNDGDAVQVVLAPGVHGPGCLGGTREAEHLGFVRFGLQHVHEFDRLPMSLGPQVALGSPQAIPVHVERPTQWLLETVFKGTGSSGESEKAVRGPRRATFGQKYFQRIGVEPFVSRRFQPHADLGGVLARCVGGLDSVSHWVSGRERALLLEPVVLGLHPDADDDVPSISKQFAAYKYAIRLAGRQLAVEPELIAYVIGTSAEGFESVRSGLQNVADSVIRTSHRGQSDLFAHRIQEVGRRVHAQGELDLGAE